MNERRRILEWIAGAGLVGTAGCLGQVTGTIKGNEEWTPEVQGDEPELSPGAATTITIQAGPIQTLEVNPIGETGIYGEHQQPDGLVELDYFDISIKPSPFGSLDSIPPVWHWTSPVDARVTLGVQVAGNAPPGDYPYSVNITKGDEVPQDGERKTVEFVMTVAQD